MLKNIKVIPFLGIEDAYIVVSFRTGNNGVEQDALVKNSSFLYDLGGRAVEWEPSYGPLTLIRSCEEGEEGARPHFFWPYFTGNSNWSQLAVDDLNLQKHLLNGEYETVFKKMKEWGE